MADFENPFSGIGEAVANFWGPSVAMKRQRELLGHQAGQEAAQRTRDQDARDELATAWAEAQQAANGDRSEAIKRFVTSPAFFANPLVGKDTATMMRTLQEITAPPGNITMKEGDQLRGPNGELL